MSVRKLKSYDYKVYVTGPFQAGKTTLIHTLDPDAISIERGMKEEFHGEKSTTTTGFDLGRVIWVRKEAGHIGLIVPKKEYEHEKAEYSGWIAREIELRGVPGQLHFKFVRDTMRTNTDGVLMIVDSSDPAMIGDASAILAETIAAFGSIPLEIIANKQDRADAVPPEDVASWLGVSEATGTSAKNRESAKDALVLLLRKLDEATVSSSSSENAVGTAVVKGDVA
ncbi:MAG: ADP-ribosylation factor-like protein [Candidatus Thorarchaeota archaeon]